MAADVVREVPVTRVDDHGRSLVQDHAAVEEPLEIRLHGSPFAVVMRTPGADRELAAGFLFAERVVRRPDELGAIEPARDDDGRALHNVVDVRLSGVDPAVRLETERRTVTSASCGLCGRQTIHSLRTEGAPLTGTSTVAAHVVHALPDALRRTQAVFEATGGLHAAGLFRASGRLVHAAEDVGRHNAVDKIVGRLLLDRRLPCGRGILFVSGRTSYEIVQKAFLAGVPIVAAVSAPSSLAIELARGLGVTLIGFVRPGRFNVYAHEQRVVP